MLTGRNGGVTFGVTVPGVHYGAFVTQPLLFHASSCANDRLSHLCGRPVAGALKNNPTIERFETGNPAVVGRANVSDLVKHIDYAVRLIGSDSVEIASDFDGAALMDGTARLRLPMSRWSW